MAVRLNCGITLNSQDTNANTSNVTAWVDAITTQGSYNLTGGAHGTVTFGGNASGSYNFNATFNKLSTTRIYTRQFTVNHNADGTGSVSFNVSFDTQVSSGTIYGSTSLSLPTIPRASRPSVTGSLVLGQAMTIRTNRASSNFTHTLRYRFNNGGNTGTIATSVGASYSYTPPLSLANSVPSASSFSFAVICDTYNGVTLIGTNETIVTLSIPGSIGPVVTGINLSDVDGHYFTYGAYIQGRSMLQATVQAAGQNGATIVDYRFEYTSGGVAVLSSSGAANTQTLGIPASSGSGVVNCIVTDSRGRTASISSGEITVAPYIQPSITQFIANRWDTEMEEADDESDIIRIVIAASGIETIGTVSNSYTVSLYVRLRSADAQEQFIGSWSNSGASFTRTLYPSGYAATSSWTFRVVVTDILGASSESTYYVGTASPVLDVHYRGDCAAFFRTANRFYAGENGGGFSEGDDLTGLYLNDDLHLFQNGSHGGIVAHVDNGSGETRASRIIKPIYATMLNQGIGESGSRNFVLPQFLRGLSIDRGARLNFNIGGGNHWPFLSANSTSNGTYMQMWLTNGGLRGNVYTRLWSGRAEIGSTFTVEGIKRYNLFSVMTTKNRACICGRRTAEDTYIGGCSAMGSVQNTSGIMVQFVALRINGDQVTVTAAHQAQWTGSVWSGQDGSPTTAIANIVGII